MYAATAATQFCAAASIRDYSRAAFGVGTRHLQSAADISPSQMFRTCPNSLLSDCILFAATRFVHVCTRILAAASIRERLLSTSGGSGDGI